jgi:hypothetical protein
MLVVVRVVGGACTDWAKPVEQAWLERCADGVRVQV